MYELIIWGFLLVFVAILAILLFIGYQSFKIAKSKVWAISLILAAIIIHILCSGFMLLLFILVVVGAEPKSNIEIKRSLGMSSFLFPIIYGLIGYFACNGLYTFLVDIPVKNKLSNNEKNLD